MAVARYRSPRDRYGRDCGDTSVGHRLLVMLDMLFVVFVVAVHCNWVIVKVGGHHMVGGPRLRKRAQRKQCISAVQYKLSNN